MKAKSDFTGSRFFEEDDTHKETMSPTITSMGKGSMKNAL